MGQNPIRTGSVNINTWLVNGCTSRKIMVFTNIFRLWSILISRCARFKLKNTTSTYKTLPSRMPDWMWRFYKFCGYSDVCCFDPYQKSDYTREDGRHPWRAKPSAPFSVRQRTSSLFATWYTQQKTSPVTNHVDFIQHFPQLIWFHDIHVKSIPWVLVEFVLNWFVRAIGSETEGVVV